MYKSKSTNEVYHIFKFLSTVFLKILSFEGRALKIEKIEVYFHKIWKRKAGKVPCLNYSSSSSSSPAPVPYSPPALQ